MNDHETTVLAERLNRLADHQTPQLDVVGQVRAARERHRRQRLARIGLVGVAAATVAIVVGVTTAIGTVTASSDGEVARPTTSAPATTTTDAAPTTPPPAAEPVVPSGEPTGLPAGWEWRTFQGVKFAVPPGARIADAVDEHSEPSFMDGPSFTWNGPPLGADEYSYVEVTVREPFEGGPPPRDGDFFRPSIPGADEANGYVQTRDDDPGTGRPTVERTVAGVQFMAGGRLVGINAQFPAGPAGQQMGRALIASLSVTSPDGATETPGQEAAVPAGWEPRSFLGVTFAVPSRDTSRYPEYVDEIGPSEGPQLIWYGADLGGDVTEAVNVQVGDRSGGALTGYDGWDPVAVRGAQEAYMVIDTGHVNGVEVTELSLTAVGGERYAHFACRFQVGPEGEQMARDLIATITVN